MDGTYNNPFAQGKSPSTPDTPSGGTYQVNVNRTKTRKWVEAKVQSYDGDDWGADEFDEDDEEPEPMPPVPRVTTGLRPVGQRLPSETLRSSPRLPAPVPSSSRSASGPPSLHLQTGQPEEEQTAPPIPSIPPHVQDSPRSTPSPVSGRNASPVPLPSQRQQPPVGHPDARSSTPQSAASPTPARPSPFARPTELSQHTAEDKQSSDSSQPILNVEGVKLSDESTQLKDSSAQHHPELDLSDVGQVSLLESGFLSGSGKDETESSTKAATNEPVVGLKGQAPVLSPMPDPRSIPPLRTPSPQAKGTTLPAESKDVALRPIGTSDITPTEPLQPRRPDHSTSNFEPQPIQREPTMSTATSSPVKESDMLSDEIMRSLSPAASGPILEPIGETTDSLAPNNNQDPRDSSYTLSDYDNYWADGKEKSVLREKNTEPAGHNPAQGLQEPIPPKEALLNVSADTSSGGDKEPGLRRQFSWEAMKVQPPANEPPESDVPSSKNPSPIGQTDTEIPKDTVPDVSSPRVETPKIVIPTDSELGTAPQSQPLPSMLEPTSPVSTRTEESAAHGSEDRRPSLLEEKMLAEPATLSETPTDAQSIVSSTPATKPGQMPQVMGLKDIMGLPTSAQRLNQYEESRQAFAVVELGLNNWIQSLKSQHPEYTNATSSYGGISYQTSAAGANTASSSGLAPVQQPYYQQYLNASSPTTTAPPTSRSRLGGLPLSTQVATSAFGNSSNQIGTKSKEFMHSAGKMGKGLFSKGRSKLRGTGDKGEPIPPPVVHPNVQNKRRSSWGMSVSARSRTEAMHSDREMTSLLGQDRPQSSQSGRMHPASWAGESGRRHVSLGPLGPYSPQSWKIVQEASASPSRGGGQVPEAEHREEEEKKEDVTTWEIPTPVDREKDLWVPSTTTREPGVARDDSSEHSGVQLDEVGWAQAHETVAPAASIDEDSDEEWIEVVSPHSTAASVRMVPAEPALVEARSSLSVAHGETRFPQAQPQIQPRTLSQTKNEAQQEMSFTPIPRDPGPSTQQYAPQETDPPQRNPSFVGLPPIRRGSTFGLTPKAARSTTERFSVDEDEEHGMPLAPAPTRLPGNSTAGNGVAPAMTESLSPNSLISRPEATLPYQTTSARMSSDPEMVTSAPPEQLYPVTEPEQDQTHPHSPGSPDQQQHQNLPSDGAPPMMPPNMVGNPIQKLPPAGAGDWKLEESHLSEPLHSVFRNRAGTSSSQQRSVYGLEKETGGTQRRPDSEFDKETGSSQRDQQPLQVEPTYEYDKETGVTRPVPARAPASTPVSPTSPAKQRQKPSSDVPPSSTNRFPELFRQGDPRPRASSLACPPLPGQQFQQFDQLPGHFFQDPPVPGAGANPDAEGSGGERGRRKSSGLFKELGSRFARPSERQGSIEPTVKQHPPAEHMNDRPESEIVVDDMHPSQMKPPKGSFLSSLRSRASMDRLPQGRDDMPGSSQLQGPPQARPDQMRPDTAQSQSERKHTRFASLGITSGPFKLKSPGQPVSSASSIVNEPGATLEPRPPPSIAPPKKRFSGFSNRSGKFNRSSLDIPPKPGTPSSVRPSTGHQTPDPAEYMAPPPSIAGLARSTTDGPAPFVPPKMPVAVTDGPSGPEPRKRRGSAGSLISGFLGHVRNRSQPQGDAVGSSQGQFPPGQGPSPTQAPQMQGPPNQLPPAQNPLGQHPPPRSPLAQPPLTQGSQSQIGVSHPQRQVSAGQPHPVQRAIRTNPQVQIPAENFPNGQPASGLAPQLPPLGHMSPVQLQEQAPWGQQHQGPPRLDSPAAQPLTPPPIPRQMNGNSLLSSQVQTFNERPFTGGQQPVATSQGFVTTENNPSQSSFNQPRPSPLCQGPLMMPEESSGVSNINDLSRLSQNMALAPTHDTSIKMRSGSRGTSPTPSTLHSHILHHAPSKSLDNVLQGPPDGVEIQRASVHSTSVSFQSDVRASHVRRDSHMRDDLPTSPVSQMSKTDPPSIASSHFNQSPPLPSTTGFSGRGSQPGTPSLSATSNTPPMQTQGYGTRTTESEQQTAPSSLFLQHHQHQQHQQRPGSVSTTPLPQQQQLTASPSPFPQQHQQQVQQQQAPPPQQLLGTRQGNLPPGQQTHSLRANPSIQTMPSLSSQVSMHSPRPPIQAQGELGPQVPLKNNMPPLGPPLAQINVPPRHDSPASKWKGLKNRMSGQAAPKLPHDHGKTEGGEKKSSKLFSAFKRNSKVPPPGQNGAPGFLPPAQVGRPQGMPQHGVPLQHQMHVRQQMQPGRQIPPEQQPQQFMVQTPAQGYVRPQSSQPNSPIGQQSVTPMANINPQMRQSPPMGQQSFQPINPAVGQQPHVQGAPVGYVMTQRPPGNRQPGPSGQPIMNPRQVPQGFQPQPQTQHPRQGYSEPQYDQVPIPKGYAAVHGESMAVSASYYIGKGPNPAHFQQQQQQLQQPVPQPIQHALQHAHAQPQPQPVSANGPPVLQRQTPPQQTVLTQSRPQPQPQPQPPLSQLISHNDDRLTNRLETRAVHGEQVEHSPAKSRGGFIDASLQSPQGQRTMTNNSHSSESTNSSPKGISMNTANTGGNDTDEARSPTMQVNENGLAKLQEPQGSVAAASPQSLLVGAETLSRQQEPVDTSRRYTAMENGLRPISLSPTTIADGTVSRSHSQAHSTSAVSDEASIDANVIQSSSQASTEDVASNSTHEIKRDNVGENDAFLASDERSHEVLARTKTRNHGAPAELEDTTNAHARKMRLQTQEEKIHYDPDADSDGEPPPQMSATSYPGQEWNPYGMPEYGEWND